MKYIDNDMDDLFNKAGRDYPLNTDNRNWDAVQQALSGQPLPVQASARRYRRYNRYLPLLLLLLLPLYFIIPHKDSHPLKNGDQQLQSGKVSETPKQAQRLPHDPLQGAQGLRGSVPQNAPDAPGTKPSLQNAQALSESKTSPQNAQAVPASKPSLQNAPSIARPATAMQKSGRSRTTQTFNRHLQPQHKTTNAPQDVSLLQSTNTNDLTVNEAGIVHDPQNAAPSNAELKHRSSLPPLSPFNDQNDFPVTVFTGTPPVMAQASLTDKTHQQHPKKFARFYYGLIAGPDVSTIRNQKVTNIGSNAGLAAGYRFSNKWSMEARALWSSKKYYTDGKYFDKQAASLPASLEVYYLDGGCSMFEFPLLIRYAFTPAKHSFFAAAGLNSYVMKKESYHYRANSYGTVYDGYRSYNRSGNHLFSNLQISGGYQHTLTRGIQVRIEPYVQVPLKQIGIGRLPVTSLGLHIGLMRDAP